jgi:ribose-phosphate pyrophosphokinase
VAVHGVLAGGAYPRLLAAGVRRLVTCNTIVHPTNEIDVHDLLAAAAARQLRTA